MKAEEVKKTEEQNEVPTEVPVVAPENVPVTTEIPPSEEKGKAWTPKTILGRQVLDGTIKSIDEIILSGRKIIEPGIVNHLVPNLQSELLLIGGRTGKGGGIQRIPIRITAKMHRSGRRFRTSSMMIVGNGDGLVGVGRASSSEPRTAMEKALNKAKISIIRIRRGCGDWECGCGTEHSILFKTKGKSGSVRVELLPAPKGVGLVADNESKKILKLAGIKDVWVRTFGNTANRINLIYAMFDALKNLYVYEK
ncbi:MAG: 30S ribosomal protein S5 [Candidatus Aenigmarchaeota archaeon]|nr:30S ribosomal protein S5 [Candidatus Aenigmarchaeota archaeon]